MEIACAHARRRQAARAQTKGVGDTLIAGPEFDREYRLMVRAVSFGRGRTLDTVRSRPLVVRSGVSRLSNLPAPPRPALGVSSHRWTSEPKRILASALGCQITAFVS